MTSIFLGESHGRIIRAISLPFGGGAAARPLLQGNHIQADCTMPTCWWVLLILVQGWLTVVWSQVTVQIREAHIAVHPPGGSNSTNNVSSSELAELEVRTLHTYSFPDGFSNPLDWFIMPYANIPPQGISGVLYHPLPNNGCSDSLTYTGTFVQGGNKIFNGLNLSMLALVDDYHVCTEQKLISLEAVGFDAMITFSADDSNRAVGRRVLDTTASKFVDVLSFGLPTVVVSQQFSNVLLAEGVVSTDITNAKNETCMFVHISSDRATQDRVGFGLTLSLTFVLVGVPVLTFLCLCCCICCLCAGGRSSSYSCRNCCLCRKLGSYNVHQVHVRVLGDDLVLRQPQTIEESETSFSARSNSIATSVPLERFKRIFENESDAKKSRKYMSTIEKNMCCAICLEEFEEDETIHALSCDTNHVFHPQCINIWLETHSMCPLCRMFIVQPNF